MPRGCTNTSWEKSKYIGDSPRKLAQQYYKNSSPATLSWIVTTIDRKRLTPALHQPIPRSTKATVAQNKAEIASRSEATAMQKDDGTPQERPGGERGAAPAGEPPWVDPQNDPCYQAWSAAEAQMTTDYPRRPGEKSVGVEAINSRPGSEIPPTAG